MAPILRNREDCIPCFNISIDHNNSAAVGTNNYHDEDKHALLYIVCTLVFYSLGMIVGIVSYIKREKEDIEQDRMFNEFLTSFRGNTEEVHYRQLKVQETIDRLAEIERIQGLSDKSYSDCGSRKPSSSGISISEKANLLKFANLSLLRAPVVVVSNSNMASEIGKHEPGNDIDYMDPFEDRRLSEVVAQMLDHENEDIINEISGNNKQFKSDKDTETELIDYNKEPRNKDLYREAMQNIEETNLEETSAAESSKNISAFRSNDVLKTELKGNSDTDQGNAIRQNIKTTVGKSIETVFGVTMPQENTEIEVEKRTSNETVFGVDTEQDDVKFRWSVTSV